jgi:hypothetical protein
MPADIRVKGDHLSDGHIVLLLCFT